MLSTLELQSGYARTFLLNSEMMCSAEPIERSYAILHTFYDVFVQNTSNGAHLQMLQFRLQGLRNIHGTLLRLEQGAPLDDIELFEIKNLALLTCDVHGVFAKVNMDTSFIDGLCDLNAVVDILNPDPIRMASFYIYDSYSPELRSIRELLKKSPDNKEALFAEAVGVEDKIRAELSHRLMEFVTAIKSSLVALANIDINVAKALQIKKLGLCFPAISNSGTTCYSELFNPEVKAALNARKQNFQPVNISFGKIPTLITGANMGGKTVVLKSLTLSQYLFQFGFGVPAQSAQVEVKDEVHFCIGDEQSSNEGLSSFAAEMKRIDRLIGAVKAGKNIIALIDEPARTTNPVEGTALVLALLKVLSGKSLNLLVTTHYNVETDCCKCLRVKGLVNGAMDYQLVEAVAGEVPHEALNIAESLGIDSEWIAEARMILNPIHR